MKRISPTVSKAFVGAAVVGTCAAIGEFIGLALGLAQGGKHPMLLSAYSLAIAATAIGLWIALRFMGIRALMPTLAAGIVNAALLLGVGIIGSLLREPVFEGDVIRPLYIVSPGCGESARGRGSVHVHAIQGWSRRKCEW